MKPGYFYSVVKPMLRTYDLLLFRGSDAVSGTIAKVEVMEDGAAAKDEANFTHVGIVFLGEDLMPPADDEEKKWLRSDAIYVLESTMSGGLSDGCEDVHGESHLGVQLRLLDDVVSHYDKPEKTRMAWCALKVVPAKPAKETARAEYNKYRGLSYDLSVVDLLACAFKGVRGIRDNTAFEHIRDAICRFIYGKKRADNAGGDNLVSKWQFCSEMAANIYKDIGVLPEKLNPSNVMPSDFVIDPANPEKTLDSDKEVLPIFSKPVRFHK